jgi:hypothetical protein
MAPDRIGYGLMTSPWSPTGKWESALRRFPLGHLFEAED